MRIYFKSLDLPKKSAKRLKKQTKNIDIKLSKAQEIISKMLGYRNWNELKTITEKDNKPASIFCEYTDTETRSNRLEYQASILAAELSINIDKAHEIASKVRVSSENAKLCDAMNKLIHHKNDKIYSSFDASVIKAIETGVGELRINIDGGLCFVYERSKDNNEIVSVGNQYPLIDIAAFINECSATMANNHSATFIKQYSVNNETYQARGCITRHKTGYLLVVYLLNKRAPEQIKVNQNIVELVTRSLDIGTGIILLGGRPSERYDDIISSFILKTKNSLSFEVTSANEGHIHRNKSDRLSLMDCDDLKTYCKKSEIELPKIVYFGDIATHEDMVAVGRISQETLVIARVYRGSEKDLRNFINRYRAMDYEQCNDIVGAVLRDGKRTVVI